MTEPFLRERYIKVKESFLKDWADILRMKHQKPKSLIRAAEVRKFEELVRVELASLIITGKHAPKDY